MPFRKNLSHRFFNILKTPPSSVAVPNIASLSNFRRSSAVDRGFSRFLHRRPFFQSTLLPGRLSLSVGDQLIDRIRSSMSPDQLIHDGLAPQYLPPPMPSERVITVKDARKILRASQIAVVQTMLHRMSSSCISYSEFAKICGQAEVKEGEDGEKGIAQALDEAGTVIVLGDVVLLRPELIMGVVQSLISSSKIYQDDPRRVELKKMQQMKAEIDRKAESLVKKELWFGLGLLLLQTTGFIRLTFWELSWDVMEPICFFVASIDFLFGYAFFLRTSRDPSFEGVFESRFKAKQKRLMKTYKFDMKKFKELHNACNLHSTAQRERSDVH